MDDRCPSDPEFAAMIELPEGDTGRAHVERCPRCQARLIDLNAFLRPATEAEIPGLASVERRMAAALEAEMERDAASAAPRPVPSGPADTASARPTRTGALVHLWNRPAWVMAAAAAALVMVAGVFALWPHAPGGDALRGTSGPGNAANRQVHVFPARIEGARAILRWRAVPGADSYLVSLFGSDLAERGRLGPLAGTAIGLPLDTLAAGGGPAGPLVWQVIALRAGDELARSALQTALPER